MKRRTKIIGGLAALLVVGGTTSSFAAIPDSDDNEFHVCIQTNRSVNSQYTMYVIDPQYQTNFNGGCNTGYTHHVLNQEGPKGDTGDTGPTGPAGAAAPTPHLKVIKKSVATPPGGTSNSGEVWACPEGYIATSVGWAWTPNAAATGDIVTVRRARVNPLGNNPREFELKVRIDTDNAVNGGQGDLYAYGHCMSGVVSDGVE